MISQTARSWLQSLGFLVNMRTGIKARSMVLTMVYNKISRLKNAGDKSVGEVQFIKLAIVIIGVGIWGPRGMCPLNYSLKCPFFKIKQWGGGGGICLF